MIYNDTLTNKNVDETLAVNFVSGFLFELNGSFFFFLLCSCSLRIVLVSLQLYSGSIAVFFLCCRSISELAQREILYVWQVCVFLVSQASRLL